MIREEKAKKKEKEKQFSDALCVALDSSEDRLAFGYSHGFVVYNFETKVKLVKVLEYPINLIRFTHENTIVTLTKDQENSKLALWQATTDLDVLVSSTVKLKLQSLEVAPGRIVVACPLKVYVLDSSTFTLMYADETHDNREGRFAVSQQSNTLTLAYPRTKKGNVKLVNLKEWQEGPLYSCHQSSIRYLGITDSAERFCTCSVKFTVVRVFNSETGEKLQQVWISGKKDPAVRMRFSPEGDWLAVVTSNGSFKVYSIYLTEKEKISTRKTLQIENPVSAFSFLSKLSESLGQEQALSEYKLDISLAEGQAEIRFRPTNSWAVAFSKPSESSTVKILELGFDPIHGGKCFKTVVHTL